jgi:hypothetical protein
MYVQKAKERLRKRRWGVENGRAYTMETWLMEGGNGHGRGEG